MIEASNRNCAGDAPGLHAALYTICADFLITPQAVEAAEAAVAVVQTRLMEALRSKADLVAEVARMKRSAEVDMSRMEAEV